MGYLFLSVHGSDWLWAEPFPLPPSKQGSNRIESISETHNLKQPSQSSISVVDPVLPFFVQMYLVLQVYTEKREITDGVDSAFVMIRRPRLPIRFPSEYGTTK